MTWNIRQRHRTRCVHTIVAGAAVVVATVAVAGCDRADVPGTPPAAPGAVSSDSTATSAPLGPEVEARVRELMDQGLTREDAINQAVAEYWTPERMRDAKGL